MHRSEHRSGSLAPADQGWAGVVRARSARLLGLRCADHTVCLLGRGGGRFGLTSKPLGPHRVSAGLATPGRLDERPDLGCSIFFLGVFWNWRELGLGSHLATMAGSMASVLPPLPGHSTQASEPVSICVGAFPASVDAGRRSLALRWPCFPALHPGA